MTLRYLPIFACQGWNVNSREGDSRPALCNAFGRAYEMTSEIDVESAAKVLSRWLHNCQKHPACSDAERPRELPRRLLHLSTGGPLKLVETNTIERSLISSYTTLSYCWGQPGRHTPPLCTTRETYKSRTKGIAWSDLPTLFRDAVLLTQALGCHHLWIDSLCIIQDDEQDWIEQSASMSDIYSSGYVNIAAAAATSPSATLFHKRQQFIGFDDNCELEFGETRTHAIKPPVATVAPVYVRRSHTNIFTSVLGNSINGREFANPLLHRAWVF